MSDKENKAVTAWLFTVCVLIMLMIVVGGYVRLTRSGLSIVEWKPVSGVIPPIATNPTIRRDSAAIQVVGGAAPDVPLTAILNTISLG